MRTFSDDIISPETLKSAITTAFYEQNEFFAHQVERQHKMIRRSLVALLVMNVVSLVGLAVLVFQAF